MTDEVELLREWLREADEANRRVSDENERLRKEVMSDYNEGWEEGLSAMKAENERLREALKPFAELVDKPVNIYECKGVQLALIKFDDLSRLCRAAKVALESKNGRDRQF